VRCAAKLLKILQRLNEERAPTRPEALEKVRANRTGIPFGFKHVNQVGRIATGRIADVLDNDKDHGEAQLGWCGGSLPIQK
jgi:hypothetical protein